MGEVETREGNALMEPHIEELREILRQFINKTEARLEKLEVIHTRYTGDLGPQGPKGDILDY